MDMTPAMLERLHDSPPEVRAMMFAAAPPLPLASAEPALPAPPPPKPEKKPATKKRAARSRKNSASRKSTGGKKKAALKKPQPKVEEELPVAAPVPPPAVATPATTVVLPPSDPWATSAVAIVRVPTLRIVRPALVKILDEINAHEPEHGGILLGPIGSDLVTAFQLDLGALRTRATFTLNTSFVNETLRYRYGPAGLDCKGVVHSHPLGVPRPSGPDLDYVRRLFLKPGNENVADFLLPIICDRVFHPFVILRDRPGIATPAELVVL